MIVLLLALLVLVVGLAVAVGVGKIPVTGMGDPTSTSPYDGLPDGPVTDEALEKLRFDQTMRGYRMNQVDHVIDRLRDELRERDREIARLRGDVDANPMFAEQVEDVEADRSTEQSAPDGATSTVTRTVRTDDTDPT